MKKLLSLILALAMVFALCACGGSAAPKTENAGSPTQDMENAGSPTQDLENTEKSDAPAADAKHFKMGLAMNSLQAPAFHAWADYLEMRLQYEAEQRGYTVELITLNAENDVTKQANDIKDLIAAGCDAIFCPCLDSNAILQSVSEVHKAGIPYISYCREVSKDATGDQIPDVTVNFASEEQAYVGMVDLFNLMKKDGIEPVKIIDCYGDSTDENAHNREGSCWLPASAPRTLRASQYPVTALA